MSNEVGGFRTWAMLMTALALYWISKILTDWHLFALGFVTYFWSELTFATWQMRGFSSLAAILIATAVGGFATLNWWFMGYQDLRQFAFLRKFFTNRKPSAEKIKKGGALQGWPLYAFVAATMFFCHPLPSTIFARILKVNKWVVLILALSTSAVKNVLLGEILSFLPWHMRLWANLILVFAVGVVLALKNKNDLFVHSPDADEA